MNLKTLNNLKKYLSKVPKKRELVTIYFGAKPNAYILIEDGKVALKSPDLDKYFWMSTPTSVIAKAAKLPGMVRMTSKELHFS